MYSSPRRGICNNAGSNRRPSAHKTDALTNWATWSIRLFMTFLGQYSLPEGVEPSTLRLTVARSNQLSYGRIKLANLFLLYTKVHHHGYSLLTFTIADSRSSQLATRFTENPHNLYKSHLSREPKKRRYLVY